jgi:hypothetical protein
MELKNIRTHGGQAVERGSGSVGILHGSSIQGPVRIPYIRFRQIATLRIAVK